VQSVQVIPAESPANGVKVASIRDKASQGQAVGGEACFQVADGESLRCRRHETERQDLLTFAPIPEWVCCQDHY
jgi:hypothetical protein